MPLQVRRGTETQRTAMTEPLASGELLYVTNTGTLYIGNGTSIGGVPVANLSEGGVRDISAALLTGGTHVGGISFAYDGTNVNATVDTDLSDYQGVIRADGFQGSLFADDSGTLVDGLNGSINLDGTVKGDIVPDSDSAYDIGSATLKFKDLYLSGTSLYLGDAVITSSGGTVELPAGSTVGGVEIGSGGGGSGSDYSGNIIGDDSSVIINTSTYTVTAVGGVTGNIFTNLIDSADSSAITVTPSVIFNSDITVENEINASKIVIGGDVITSIGRELVVTAQDGAANDHYLTFVESYNVSSLVQAAGTLRYNPADEILYSGGFVGDGILSIPSILTSQLEVGEIESLGLLVLSSALTTGAQRRLVQVGSGLVDGRFGVVTNTYFGANAFVSFSQAHETADVSNMSFVRSRGTTQIPLPVNTGDDIADITFSAYNGTSNALSAGITVSVEGTITSSAAPGKIDIFTADAAGTFATAVSINSKQQTTFNGAVTLAVYADNTARDAAITAPTAGMMIFNTTGTKFQGYTGAAWVDLN